MLLRGEKIKYEAEIHQNTVLFLVSEIESDAESI
jgi:hypothetical protein